ncbi:MAG TPA: hypothetical protein VFG31_06340 [Conexibacter sp.]|nr:hypothetical protein [Conexibacter sp.]
MPDQEVRLDERIVEPDGITGEVFRLLVLRHPALVPIDDLIRELTFPGRPHITSPPMFVSEAVDRLFHDGLAHRIEDFAVASRAGVRAMELWQ